ACITRCRLLKAAKASSRTSISRSLGSGAASPPIANTASPSISWISSGGERWPTTSSSRAAMMSEPCSSSVVVTNRVKPETSARIRKPWSVLLFMPLRHQPGADVKRGGCWLSPLQDVQPAAPVDQVEEPAPVDLHVVAGDAGMAGGRLGQEVGNLAGSVGVRDVHDAEPVGEPGDRDLGAGHPLAGLVAAGELRLRV